MGRIFVEGRALVALSLIGCGGEPPPVPPTAARPPLLAAAEAPSVSPELRAHRDAELAEWLRVDELIGRCYEAHWAAHPSIAGAVAVRFTIQTDGHAMGVAIAAADPHDEAAETCIVDAVSAMPFTPSGEPVERTIERRFDAP